VAKFKDYYDVLGVSPHSHAKVIEETYWATAHELHRVLHIEPTKKLQKKLNQINEAYEVLGSPYKRSSYDRQRADIMGQGSPAVHQSTLLQSFVMVLSKPFRPD
jgi:curved DNA-binding protein CbpA